MFKTFRVKIFCGYDCPRKFFNNKIFPDYGMLVYPCVHLFIVCLLVYSALCLLCVYLYTSIHKETSKKHGLKSCHILKIEEAVI